MHLKLYMNYIAFAIYLGCQRASDVAPSNSYCGDGSAPLLVLPSKGEGGRQHCQLSTTLDFRSVCCVLSLRRCFSQFWLTNRLISSLLSHVPISHSHHDLSLFTTHIVPCLYDAWHWQHMIEWEKKAQYKTDKRYDEVSWKQGHFK